LDKNKKGSGCCPKAC